MMPHECTKPVTVKASWRARVPLGGHLAGPGPGPEVVGRRGRVSVCGSRPPAAATAGRAELRAAVDVGVVDVPDHRVAAGDRVVGQEEHRLPGRRHLQRARGPCPRWAARRRGAGQRRAVEPQADPVAVAGDRRRAASRAASSAPSVNQSSRGPGARRSDQVAGRRLRHRREVDAGHAGRSGADGEHGPAAAAGRAEPGEQVGRPGPEDRRRRRTRRGPRGSVRSPPAGTPSSQLVAGRRERRVGALWAGEPSPGRGAGDHDHARRRRARSRSPPRVISSTGGVLGVADQPVRQPARRPGPPRRSGPTPEVRVPGPAERPAPWSAARGQHRHRAVTAPASTNRTRVAGPQQRGRVAGRGRTLASVRPISCQPPGESRG